MVGDGVEGGFAVKVSRRILMSTTVLSGVVGIVFHAGVARAADLPLKAPAREPYAISGPAVDDFNAKFEAFGGSYGSRGLYGAGGSVAAPLQRQWGVQFDAAGANYAGHSMSNLGAHLFWRDPAVGLLGIYVDHARINLANIHATHVAAEGELYWKRWTVRALVGVETGTTAIGSGSASAVIGGGGLAVTTTPLVNDTTRFFDAVDLSYYITDQWKASIGHRLYSGRNALALGMEYALPVGRGALASLFAEVRVGEGSHNTGAWGGVKFYFSGKDKPLIRRNREDDPTGTGIEPLLGIASSFGSTFPSTSFTCPAGEHYQNGTLDVRAQCDFDQLTLESGTFSRRVAYYIAG